MKTTRPKSILEQMEDAFVSEMQDIFDFPIDDDSDYRSMREWQIDREIANACR